MRQCHPKLVNNERVKFINYKILYDHRFKVVKGAYHKAFNELKLVKLELEKVQQEVLTKDAVNNYLYQNIKLF